MQNIEVRVNNVERDIIDINSDLKELKKEMSTQDEKIEKKIDARFKEIESKIDKNNETQTTKSDKISDGIGSIKDSMHTQELANLELKHVINGLVKDKENDQVERNKLKWGVYSMAFTLIGSLIMSWLRIVFGF